MSEIEYIAIAKNQQLTFDVPANAQKTLLITYESDAELDNELTFDLAPGAQVLVYHIQNSSMPQLNNTISVRQEKDSNFTMADISLGAKCAVNKIDVELNGQGAHCDLYGLFVANEKQQLLHDITVTHNAAHTTSNQDYKGLADGDGKGVLNSRVVVNKGAQKISSVQSSKNMLLSKTATIQTQPELEIYADDVQCAHGATVGELDVAALFYLRSRGINKDDAVALMTYAFVGENIDRIESEVIRQQVRECVLPKIPNSQSLVGTL